MTKGVGPPWVGDESDEEYIRRLGEKQISGSIANPQVLHRLAKSSFGRSLSEISYVESRFLSPWCYLFIGEYKIL